MRIFWAPILKFVLLVSYAEMLRFRFKKKFSWTIIGGDRIVLRILRLRRMKNFFVSYVNFFVIFQVSNVPFIFANNSFSNI